MQKPTSRRTSLQPVFEPFDCTPMIPSLPTNGFHAESMDDEATNPFNGLYFEPNSAAVNSSAANGAESNGSANNGEPVANGNLNGGANHSEHQIAEEHAADPDLVDLAAARKAFSEAPSNGVANQIDTASRNGQSHLNGHAHLNGIAEAASVAPQLPADPPPDVLARAPIPAPPPVVVVEPVQPAAPPALDASSVPAPILREPHPASGSMFAPYLVTEIRELRNRRQRRRSWWRRLFG